MPSLRFPLFCLHDLLRVTIEGNSIERDHQGFAAVIVVALVLFLGYIDHGEREVLDVTVFWLAYPQQKIVSVTVYRYDKKPARLGCQADFPRADGAR